MGGEHSVVARDATTGDEEWAVDLNGHPVGSSPTVSEGVVYIESGGFAAFDAASGDLDWRHEQAKTEIGESPDRSPTVGDGTVYFSHSIKPDVHAFETATGEKQWMTELNGRPTQSVLDEETLYVGTGTYGAGEPTGRLYAVDPETGDKRWSVETGPVSLRGPVVRDGTVYAIGQDTLSAIQDGEIAWTHGLQSGATYPVMAGEYVIVDGRERVAGLR